MIPLGEKIHPVEKESNNYKIIVDKLLVHKDKYGEIYRELLMPNHTQHARAFIKFWFELITNLGESSRYLYGEHGMWS